MSVCTLCPRNCGIQRKTAAGACHSPELAHVVRAAPHFGEEPCISGEHGSGTIFFSGCSLGCVYCQNKAISRSGLSGRSMDVPRLRELFLRLRDTGVHNLNLVTPSHHSIQIAEALSGIELGIPVIWNSSAYEKTDTLRRVQGLVQIYLPDYKYADTNLAGKFSQAPDYPETALAAIKEMYRQTGPFRMGKDGLLRSGVLIRHLVLPGHAENTLRVIDRIEDNFPPDSVMFSLMSQFTPNGAPGCAPYPELCRSVTREEYDRCLSYLDFSSLKNGFVQDPDSATNEMLPDFSVFS